MVFSLDFWFGGWFGAVAERDGGAKTAASAADETRVAEVTKDCIRSHVQEQKELKDDSSKELKLLDC